jgi:uncharacterized protein
MYQRNFNLDILENSSFFLWGARQTGKSTLLKTAFPNSLLFDLLKSDVYRRFLNYPEQFREIVIATNPTSPIIVDEIQKLPILLDEVHWLIENYKYQFILTGSSPRKILRQGANLLGGRAKRCELYPLSYSEIPNFDLIKALNHGLIPNHYDAKKVEPLLSAYIGSYLQDEIVAETRIRQVDIFSKFLNQVGLCNGEIINYTNIANDCGIKSYAIKEYFTILEETMIGNFVNAYQLKPKRRVVNAPKFYLFDIGVANFLNNRKNIENKSFDFGFAFEHFIYLELKAYSQYSGKHFKISYWRTSSQFEVDFILGENEVAIEVKSADNIQPKHLKGLKAFNEEYIVKKNIIVCQEAYPRLIENAILIQPWKLFLNNLWAGEVI